MGNRHSSQNGRGRLFRAPTVPAIIFGSSRQVPPSNEPNFDEKDVDLPANPDEMEHQTTNSVSTTTSTPSRVKPNPTTPPYSSQPRLSTTSSAPEAQGPRILIRSPTDPHVLLPVSSIDTKTLPHIISKWTENVRQNSVETPTTPDDSATIRNSGLQVLDDPSWPGRSHSAPLNNDDDLSRGERTERPMIKYMSSPVPVPNIFAMDNNSNTHSSNLNDDETDAELRHTRSLGSFSTRRDSGGGRLKYRSQSLGGGLTVGGPRVLRGRSSSMWLAKFRGRSSTQSRKPRFLDSHNQLVDCPPQVYIHICSFLEVKSVCRMASMCRYLYIVGENKELWRLLVRRDMNGYIRRKRKQQDGSTDAPIMNRNGYGAMTVSGIHNAGPDGRSFHRAKSLPSLAWINRYDAHRVNKKKKSQKKSGKKSSGNRMEESPMTRPTVEPKTPPYRALPGTTPPFHGRQSSRSPQPQPQPQPPLATIDDVQTTSEPTTTTNGQESHGPPQKRGFFKRMFSRRAAKTRYVSQASHTPPPPNLDGNESIERSTESQNSSRFDPNDPRSEGTLTSEKSVTETMSEAKDSESCLPIRHHHNLTVPNLVASSVGGSLGHTRAYSYNDIQYKEKNDENEEEAMSPDYSQSLDFDDDDGNESDQSVDDVYIAADDEVDEPVDQEDLELEQKISRTPLDSLDGEHPRNVYRVLQEEINNKKRLKEARKQREHLINSLRMAGLY